MQDFDWERGLALPCGPSDQRHGLCRPRRNVTGATAAIADRDLLLPKTGEVMLERVDWRTDLTGPIPAATPYVSGYLRQPPQIAPGAVPGRRRRASFGAGRDSKQRRRARVPARLGLLLSHRVRRA